MRWNWRQIIRLQVYFLGLISTALLYNNCGMVRTPTAGTVSASSFSHDGITNSCAACHATGAPFAAFPAAGHQDIGLQDCSSCHNTTTWVGSNSPHFFGAPVPTTCISCHTSRRPSGTVGTVSLVNNITPTGGLFDHATNGGQGDCVDCHTSVPTNVGVTWAGGSFSHSPMPATCSGCHSASQVPTGTTPNRVDGFTHAANFGTECASCHKVVTANVGASWSKGFFNHANNNPNTLGTCSPCHDSRFHHAGQFCVDCHNTVVYPSANGSGNYGGSWGSP